MKAPDRSETFVRALNTDNRSEVENLCELFTREGITAGYPKALTTPRTWSVIKRRANSKLTSVTGGCSTHTHGHVGLKSSAKGSDSIELVLAIGETAAIVDQLQASRAISAAQALTFLGPKAVFESGEFHRLGLRASASFASNGWMYAVTAAKEKSPKAMAYFVPEPIVYECEHFFESVGLNRKRKHRRDSNNWAIPADIGAVTAVDRRAGLIAVNPSLVGARDVFDSSIRCMLVNVFDPAAEEFISKALQSGYEFAGIAPRLSGIDYVVLSYKAGATAEAALPAARERTVSVR